MKLLSIIKFFGKLPDAFYLRFYLCNLGLAYLVGTRYLAHLTYTVGMSGEVDVSLKIRVWVLAILIYLGQLALLTLIPLFGIWVLWIVKIPERLIKGIAVIGYSLFILFLIIDTQVYALYHYHINGVIFHLVFGGEFSQIFVFSWAEWIRFFSWIILVFSLQLVAAWWSNQHCRQKMNSWIIISIFSMAMLCWMTSVLAYATAAMKGARIFMDVGRVLPFYETIIYSLMPTQNILQKLVTKNAPYFLQAPQATHRLNYPLQPLVFHTPKHLPNILFIVIDTWRYNTLNSEVTPNIQAFSQKAWRFQQHFSGGNCTGPGIFSLFYALPYSYWSSVKQEKVAPLFIQQLLHDHYQPAIFASASLKLPAFNQTVFLTIPNLKVETPGKHSYDRDATINQEFLNFLNHRHKNQPFLGFLFYDSAHAIEFPPNFPARFKPWWKKIRYTDLTNQTDPTLFLNRYKNAVYYDDSLVGKILHALNEQHVLNNTVVIITGDHGQEFNDTKRNYWGHASNYTHYQVQTPLIIYWPHHAPRIINYRTTHYDIVPFLMEKILGLQTSSAAYAVGNSLLNKQDRSSFLVGSYIDLGVIDNTGYTTIYPTGNYQVYDPNAKPLPSAPLNLPALKQAFAQMRQFYR
ncbi:MAG: sulfatase-like hydrolase/transferase [Legionellales bacterium]|nr:sulfatase-like hydrolase/transferase [Legionellales bacterium]